MSNYKQNHFDITSDDQIRESIKLLQKYLDREFTDVYKDCFGDIAGVGYDEYKNCVVLFNENDDTAILNSDGKLDYWIRLDEAEGLLEDLMSEIHNLSLSELETLRDEYGNYLTCFQQVKDLNKQIEKKKEEESLNKTEEKIDENVKIVTEFMKQTPEERVKIIQRLVESIKE